MSHSMPRENGARRAVAHARDFDGVSSPTLRSRSAAVLALDLFRFGNRRAQTHGQVVREMIAADRESPPCAARRRRRKTISSVVPPPISSRQQPSSRSSCVRHASAEASGSSTVSSTTHAGAVHRGDDVLRGRGRGGDDVDVRFQALADHADRVADVVLRVEEKFLRQHVQHFAIFGQT